MLKPLSTLSKLQHDERGNVAVLFGLSLIAATMAVGCAVDLGRAYSAKAKVSAAADAAALAAVKGMRLEGLDDAKAQALAQRVFEENMASSGAKWAQVSAFSVMLDRTLNKAVVNVNSSVPTTFAAISGISSISTNGSATAVFDAKDVEVSVQLDMTGSMCTPSCSKIADLKKAAGDLVDILLPATPTGQKVRVAFAPFAAGVNVGSYLAAVNGNRSSAKTCVYERQSATNEISDSAPTGLDAYKIREDLPTPPWPKSIQDCPKAKVVPLTDDAKKLHDEIKQFEAKGTTAGQLGAAWAWNLISPKWTGVWPTASQPAAYDPAKTDKVVILMTDGVYNTVGGVNWGDSSSEAAAARQMSVDLCTKMKDEGVTVYTVGFMLDSADATATLQACAGRKGNAYPEHFFFNAESGQALQDAFRNIANGIMRLRLSN